jgi:cytochrome c oxidase subunit 5a
MFFCIRFVGWKPAWLTCGQQRNLNNAFAYDLVPSPSVITAALKAARRVNDYPTAVRIFEGKEEAPSLVWKDQPSSIGGTNPLRSGVKAKVENTAQYEEYLEDLKPLREELGVNLKEDLYPS